MPIFDVGSGQSMLFPLPLKGYGWISIEGWSADGCSLLVDAAGSEHLVNIVTGVRRRLFGDTRQRLSSPDGEWIAAESRGGREELWQISVSRADGSEPASIIAEGQWWGGLIGWTGDSRKVVYEIQEEGLPGKGVRALYAVDVNSLEQCLIARVTEPLERWEDLYLANVASCEQVSLSLSGSLERVARWVETSISPGYRYMALLLGELQQGGDGHGINPFSFLVVDMETGREQLVLELEGEFWVSEYWAWSPDGTELVLAGDLSEGDGVYVVESATGRRYKLDIGLAFFPAWSPDGRFLALQSLNHGSFLYDLQAETILPLPAEFAPATYPRQQWLLWSPRISYGSGACR